MRYRIDRRWWLIGMAFAVIAVQWAFPTSFTTIWPPLVFVIVSIVMYRKELRAYDWGTVWKKSFWEPTFFAVTQGMIAQAIGIVAVQHAIGIQPQALPFEITLWAAMSAIVFSGILEELVYRKSVFGFLDGRISFWPAAAVSSLFFAIVHANYAAWLGYFLLGLVWCRTYKKTGDIGVVIASHMIFNAVALFVMAGRG